LGSRRDIGVARGCSGCTSTPQGGEKYFSRPNLQEKCVSASPGHEVHPPPASARVNFRTVFARWLRFGGIFTRSLRATTKKCRQLFGKKCTPDKILATPMRREWQYQKIVGEVSEMFESILRVQPRTTPVIYFLTGRVSAVCRGRGEREG